MRLLLLLAALAATPGLALAQSNPWEQTFGRKPKMWSDPEGRFTLDLPTGWTPAKTKEPAPNPIVITKTLPDYGISAVMTVEMRPLPPGTKLAHFAQRVEEEMRAIAKNYRPIDQDKSEVSGTSAIRRVFSYQQMAHAELTSEVAQVIFIVGERGFVVTLETGFGARQLFWEDFEIMMKAFSGSAPGEEASSVRPGEARKTLKPGELVNPDVAHY